MAKSWAERLAYDEDLAERNKEKSLQQYYRRAGLEDPGIRVGDWLLVEVIPGHAVPAKCTRVLATKGLVSVEYQNGTRFSHPLDHVKLCPMSKVPEVKA